MRSLHPSHLSIARRSLTAFNFSFIARAASTGMAVAKNVPLLFIHHFAAPALNPRGMVKRAPSLLGTAVNFNEVNQRGKLSLSKVLAIDS